ncbi:MAG: SDR family NAD(P)-dependent oxidoreductase [Bacteroidota bacterium]
MKRFEVGLKYLPPPDFLEFSIPNTHVILLTNDGSDLTPQLISALRKKGNQVVTLNLPRVDHLISDNAITLPDSSDQSVGKAIQTIHETYGKIGSFIHLHPHFEFQAPQFTQHFEAEKDMVKALFFIAKHIQKDLNELGEKQRSCFLSCTRLDGQLGQGKRGNTSVVGGGITGLVKCLNLEWPPVFCRALDLQAELPSAQIVDQLIAEFHDADVSTVEVAYSEKGRKTTTAIPTEVQEDQLITTTITGDAVFLVSGGARGVTATCAIEMAQSFRCKFILLGRSAIDVDLPEFAKNEEEEASLKRLIMNDLKARGEQPSLSKVKSIFKKIVAKKEIDQTIRAIQHHGSEVIYVQGDVTDSSSFTTALRQATAQLGKITGIIHGAGRLADKYIQDKTETDFENVLSVKLDGLLSLLSVVDIHHLDHLLLFSSVAGFYGNVGQTDYAIANEILSKSAHLFKTNHPNTKVSAINWGAWDSGMVSGELKAQFEAADIHLVNSEGGAAMFVNELRKEYADQAQVIIGGTLPTAVSHLGALRTHRIHRHLTLANNPFLHHHKIQNNPVLPIVNAMGWMAQSCEKLYPDYSVFELENATLFKGIVFDGQQQEKYTLELKELEKDQDRILFEACIFSAGEKLPTNHAKAKITLRHKKALPNPPQFSHQLSTTYTPTDGQRLYQDGALFHGPYFQGIATLLDCTQDQIVLVGSAPAVPLPEQGQFPVHSINTFFVDLQYQAMLVWVQQYGEGAKSLPLQTDHIRFYQTIPTDTPLFITAKIQEFSSTKMVAACTIYDEQGTVYAQTTGAAVTIAKQLSW